MITNIIGDSDNVITETYETKTDAAQKLADAKSYADQAELDAIASAKSNLMFIIANTNFSVDFR